MRCLFVASAVTALLGLAACNGGGGRGDAASLEQRAMDADSQLVPVDSIGVELGDSTLMFGTVGAVCRTSSGRIAVADVGQMRIRLFSRDGRYLYSGGRRGEGPGEFSMPGGVFPTPDGGIAVPDRMGGKIIYFDSTLSLQREWNNFSGRPPGTMTALPDGGMVGTEIDFDRANGSLSNSLCLWPADSAQPSVTYMERSAPFSRENPRQAWHETAIYFAAFPDGRVVASPESREECLITCWNADGERLWEVERPFQRVPRPQEDIMWEREMIRRQITRRGGDASFADQVEIPQWAEAVIDLQVVDNRIWVRRGGSAVPFYEVLDEDGNLLKTCSVPRLPYGSGVVVHISSHGTLAYQSDPLDYYKVYLLD